MLAQPRCTIRAVRRVRSRFSLLLPVLIAATLLGGCGAERERGESTSVLLLGVDGFEWSVLLPLVRSGEAPNFAALMEEGFFGRLETTRPTFSPIIWTSIATGKSPRQHGIRGFVRKAEGGGGRRLFNSFDRQTKAFWNILSDYERSVAVVGWWMTFPAEEVNGVMVAQVNTLDQADRKRGRAILKGGLREEIEGQVYPPARGAEFLEIHREMERTLPGLSRQIFGTFEHPLTPLTTRLWENTQWALRADATYLEIARRLAGEGHDLLALYLGGADVVGHRFWRYMEPEGYADRPTEEEIRDFGDAVRSYYRYLDTALGRVLAGMPGETTVLVVSDHGMHGVNQNKTFREQNIPNDLNSGHHRDAPAGVFIASGIRPHRGRLDPERLGAAELPTVGSVLDVTPTLLTLLGIPVGADMEGRVLARVLAREADRATQIASHDGDAWRSARAGLDAAALEEDEERLEQLRALGYVN